MPNITIYGDNLDSGSDSTNVLTEDAPDVHVSMPREDGDDTVRCVKCGQAIEQDDHGTWIDDTDGDCCNEDNELHEPDEQRFAWLNSAAIRFGDNNETVTVSLSVGDPRGGFTMSIERMQYIDEDGNEVDELRLSVPTPDDSLPHMTLTPLASSGYFRIS